MCSAFRRQTKPALRHRICCNRTRYVRLPRAWCPLPELEANGQRSLSDAAGSSPSQLRALQTSPRSEIPFLVLQDCQSDEESREQQFRSRSLGSYSADISFGGEPHVSSALVRPLPDTWTAASLRSHTQASEAR